jgi:drug/metabolite transporter (DMT)-like permease
MPKTAQQYTAALVMGMGLAILTAADVFSAEESKIPSSAVLPPSLSQSTRRLRDGGWGAIGPFLGPILLATSTVFDSIVPNLQEQLLQIARVNTSSMILVSNAVMCAVLLLYTSATGELRAALAYCGDHRDAGAVLVAQGACAYLGLRCYLAIIRDHGGVVGVLTANARKLLTIVLSFALFSKPFNRRHLAGLGLVSAGVYLGSKKDRKVTVVEKDETSSSSGERGGKGVSDRRHHEHSV